MLQRHEKDRMYRTVREHAESFATTFLFLAEEAGHTRGIKNVSVKFGDVARVEQTRGKDEGGLDAVRVVLPDPVKTLHLDRLDVNDPGFVATTAMALHETAHLVFGSPDRVYGLKGYDAMAANALADICDERCLVSSITTSAYEPLAMANQIMYETEVLPSLEGAKPSVAVSKLMIVNFSPRVGDTRKVGRDCVGFKVPTIDPWKALGLWLGAMFKEDYRVANDYSLRLARIVETVLRTMTDEAADTEGGGDKTIAYLSLRSEEAWGMFEEGRKDLALVLRELDESMAKQQQSMPQQGEKDDEEDNKNDAQEKQEEEGQAERGTEGGDNQEQEGTSEQEGGEKEGEEQGGDPSDDDGQREQDDEGEDDEDNPGDERDSESSERGCPDVMQSVRDGVVRRLREEVCGNGDLVAMGRADTRSLENSWIRRNPKSYNQAKNAMRRLLGSLLRSRVFTACKPSRRGRMVRDVEKIYTDGKVFLRRTETIGERAAIALVVDCSMSTRQFRNKMLAFMACLAESLREAGVSSAAWLFGGEVVPLSIRFMSKIKAPDLGVTNLGGAMDYALDWLEDHKEDYERRVLMIVTDGKPFIMPVGVRSPRSEKGHEAYVREGLRQAADHAREQGRRATEGGVEIVVGCVKSVSLSSFVRDVLPGAVSFDIQTNFSVSALALAKALGSRRQAC